MSKLMDTDVELKEANLAMRKSVDNCIELKKVLLERVNKTRSTL